VRARNEVVVYPKVAGRVVHVNVDVGQSVHAGDVLASLESTDQQLRAKQADAQLQLAKAGLESAKVQQEHAKSSFERAEALFKKGAMAQADFENADNGKKMADVGVHQAEAQVAGAQAALDVANQAVADTRVTALVSGIVAKRSVEAGSQATVPQALFHIQDMSSLKMEGTVSAAEVARLKKGMAVKVTVDELSGDVVTGELTQIAPTLESDTRRAHVEVTLKPGHGLMPYMFGHAEISFGEKAGVLVVPAQAVLTVGGDSLVYALRSGKAVAVKAHFGARHDNSVIVEEGLAEGDQVIISGDTGLKDGIHVVVAGQKI
jgi:RND family efflux transporter MFP subunit